MISVEPSNARRGTPAIAISATIMPGMLNSASSRPSHIRCDRARRVAARYAQLDQVTFAAKRQRLPVDRADIAKQNPIARDASSPGQGSQQRRGGGGHRNAVHCAAARDRRGHARRCAAAGRGRCEDRRQIVDRQRASRPKRVGAVSYRRRNFSTSLSKFTCRFPYSRIRLGGSFTSQCNSYLSRYFPITTKRLLMMNDPRLVLSACVPSAARILPACRECSGATRPTSSSSSAAACRNGWGRRSGASWRAISRFRRSFSADHRKKPRAPNGLVSVKRHPVTVSAGPGAIVTEELGKPYFAFDERWLKALTANPAGETVDRSRRRGFDGADTQCRRRYPGRPR